MKTKLTLCLLLCVFALTAHAQTPELINYQGKLILGGAQVNGPKTLIFAIYDDSLAATNKLWCEQHTNVLVTNGIFNVFLGGGQTVAGCSKPALSALFAAQGKSYFLEMEVDTKKLGRFRMTSAAFALRAKQAESGGTGGSGWTVSGNNVHTTVSGNVGIGITNPNLAALQIQRTDVDAVIRVETIGSSKQADQGIEFKDPGGSWFVGQRFQTSDNFFGIGTSSEKNEFVIGPVGNVGIGTTNPTVKLEVNGAIMSKGDITINGEFNAGGNLSGNGNISTGGSDRGFWMDSLGSYKYGIWRTEENEVIIRQNNLDRIKIAANGNVGIGTTSTSHKFHVFDGTSEGNGVLIEAGYPFGSGTYPDILTLKDKDHRYELFKLKSDGSFYFNRGPDRVLTGAANGNVGIGTLGSEYKLHIRAQDGALGLFESTSNGGLITLGTNEGSTNWVQIINRSGGLLALTTGGNDRLVVTRAGNVGIGGSPDNFSAAKLVVYGKICVTEGTECASDLRYKKNLAPIPNALDKITRLRGVSFHWRQEEFPELNFSKGRNLGFIAQEIKEVLPEVVSEDSKGFYSVAYSNVVPVLVEAIKEQQQAIAQLQNKAKELEETQAQLQRAQAELTEFKEKMNRMEATLQKLERLAAQTPPSEVKLTQTNP